MYWKEFWKARNFLNFKQNRELCCGRWELKNRELRAPHHDAGRWQIFCVQVDSDVWWNLLWVTCPVGQFIACFGRCFSIFIFIKFFSCFLLEFVVFFPCRSPHFLRQLVLAVPWCQLCVETVKVRQREKAWEQSVRAKRDKMCRLSKWENWGGMSSWSQNLPSGPNGSVVGSDGPCRHATFSSVQNCSLHFRDTSYRLPGCSKFELFGKQVLFFLFLWQTKNTY